MKSIAITGGIASGKSTVTGYLIEKGYIVIDADAMARSLTEPGGDAIPYIAEHFGASYIAADGSMDRARMRDLVFNNPDAKRVLEKGTTDVVVKQIAEIKDEAEHNGVEIMFFDIPLLFELRKEDDYDEIWVVSADIETRKKRILERDGIDSTVAELIIGSQAEEEYRISKADHVIRNDGSLEELYEQIDGLIKNYKIL
ncbi:MAG: dephospho-CoA kinase [Clostridiales bacterium]|nr:dephospho-CoA kinase [Candidatus Crickella caballi]